MYKYTSCWLIEVLLVSFISSQTRAISDIQHRSLISSVFCLLVARAGGRLHRERPVVQRAERARPALSAPLRAQRAAHHAPRPLRALPPARVRVLLGGAACCSISSLPLVFTYGRFKWMMPFSLPIAGLHERVRAAARAEFDRNGRHRVVQLEHQSVARRVRPPRTFNHNSSELYLNDELYFGGSVPVSALCARSAGTSFGDFGGSARVRWRICSHCFSSPFGTASSLVRYLIGHILYSYSTVYSYFECTNASGRNLRLNPVRRLPDGVRARVRNREHRAAGAFQSRLQLFIMCCTPAACDFRFRTRVTCVCVCVCVDARNGGRKRPPLASYTERLRSARALAGEESPLHVRDRSGARLLQLLALRDLLEGSRCEIRIEDPRII